MTEETMDRALDHILKHQDLADFGPGAQPDSIIFLEKKLAFNFPDSFKKFLSTLGCGDFNGNEFYGIVNNNPIASGIPSLYWINADLRNNLRWPKHFIVIGQSGFGPWICLDGRIVNSIEEPKVCLCDPHGVFLKDIKSNFEKFFYDAIVESNLFE